MQTTEATSTNGPPPMSDIQQEIFDSARTMTWRQLQEQYNISNSDAIKTCLLRTAQGYYWEPGMTGGPNFYLSHLYEERLVHIIESKAEDHRCITLPDLELLAATLRNQMYHDAHAALLARRCTQLASEINHLQANSDAPSTTWAYALAERHDLRIVQGQTIDHSRNVACERSKIIKYFTSWIPEFNRDPALIFGADETDVRIDFRERVVTTQRQQGHTESDEAINHLTAMCCHSAGGVAVPPFFILSGLMNLPHELSYPFINNPDIAWFGSSCQGWMNEGLFYSWCMLFCCWTSVYRATVLPAQIKRAEILLIVDGHYSRRCPEAIDLLRFHNIKVLVLPAHTTHLLQAFDVVLAAPLKSHFKRFFSLAKQTAGTDPYCPGTKAGKSRYLAVTAFLRAWQAVATGPACARSFRKVGISPIDPGRVLRSPFIVERADFALEENTILNNQLLTTPEMRQLLINQKTASGWQGQNILLVPLQFIQRGQWPAHTPVVHWMQNRLLADGRLFSQPKDICWPLPKWTVVEEFRRPVAVPLTPLQIANLQQQLATEEAERVERLDEEVTRIASATSTNLDAAIIKSTAERLGQARAAEVIAERSAQLSQQFLQGLDALQAALGELSPQAVQQLNALRLGCELFARGEQQGETAAS